MLLSIIASFSKGVDAVSKMGAYVAACFVAPWVIVFFIYIILRDFFHTPLAFVEEYTEYWLVMIACLSYAYALKTGAHVRVDIVFNHLPRRVKNTVDALVALIALAITCVFVREGATLFLYTFDKGMHSTKGTEALLWPSMLFIPIGYSLLALGLLAYLLNAIIEVGKDFRKDQNRDRS